MIGHFYEHAILTRSSQWKLYNNYKNCKEKTQIK